MVDALLLLLLALAAVAVVVWRERGERRRLRRRYPDKPYIRVTSSGAQYIDWAAWMEHPDSAAFLAKIKREYTRSGK